jgi:uncharacterized protein (TIGR03083 family)
MERQLSRVYEDTRGRISDLVGDLDEKATSTKVPACPEWSVHDVVAHVTGNCADIIAGNIGGAATDGWTAAQVDARRDWKIGDILAEWDEVGSQIAAMIDDFPGWYGRQMVADVTAHEHDVRGALDRPGARDSDGVAIGIDFLVNVILHSAMKSFGLGPLEVKAGDRSWTVGTGGPATHDPDAWLTTAASKEPLPSPETAPVGAMTAEPFELFRAISGRRSATQIRGFEWTVDSEPFLAAFGYGPFTIRSTDLRE